MQDSVFSQIIRGEIPCYKVYEDDASFAFLDIHPIQPGQVLVVSKRQVDGFWQLEADEYLAVQRTVHTVANAIKRAYPDKDRVAVKIEGLEVPHVHVKVYPFSTTAEYNSSPSGNTTEEMLAAAHEKITKELA